MENQKFLIQFSCNEKQNFHFISFFLSLLRSRHSYTSDWSSSSSHDRMSSASTITPRLMQHKSLEETHHNPKHDPSSSPHDSANVKQKSSTDLFELLARCQSQRLDDQRCVLPSYFSQVSRLFWFYLSDLMKYIREFCCMKCKCAVWSNN